MTAIAPFAGGWAALARKGGGDVAREVLGGVLKEDIQAALPHVALAALDDEVGGGGAALVALLRTLQGHDASLVRMACGASGAFYLSILQECCTPEAALLVAAAATDAEKKEWLPFATAGVQHATADFFAVPWREGVRRVVRAVRLARCIARTQDASQAATKELVALATALATVYHGVLSAARVPQDEASSSASPWPVDWLAAKVDVLCAADACVTAAQDTQPSDVLDALRTGAQHVPDAVSLVDSALLEDLASAQPECAALLPQRTPFPGLAWAAVQGTAKHPAAPEPNTAVVETVLAVLPHLARADVVRRLRRPRYHGMAPEAVVEAFLDDPSGLGDVEADAAQPPSAPARDEGLSDEVKATILARAAAEDEEDTTADGAPRDMGVEHALLRAYAAYGPSLFARDKTARQRPERTHLRTSLEALGPAWADDQIEAWASMLERNPHKDQLLMRATSVLTPNVNAPGGGGYGPDKLRGGRIPGQSRGARGARGGRGGRGGGRGRGRGRGQP